MFTNKQAQNLIDLPKKIVNNNKMLDMIEVNFVFPLQKRFHLLSESGQEFIFLFQIEQSKKNSIRLSLHLQEDETKIGLIRIDYNNGHKNPEKLKDTVPDKLKKYAGYSFSNEQHHIHYYVEGYNSLPWAIPLIDDSFEIKEIKTNSDITAVVNKFCLKINLITKLQINESLL
jgi:hypothetical protein